MEKHGMVSRWAFIILDGVYVTEYQNVRVEEAWHVTIGDIVIKLHDMIVVIFIQKVCVKLWLVVALIDFGLNFCLCWVQSTQRHEIKGLNSQVVFPSAHGSLSVPMGACLSSFTVVLIVTKVLTPSFISKKRVWQSTKCVHYTPRTLLHVQPLS